MKNKILFSVIIILIIIMMQIKVFASSATTTTTGGTGGPSSSSSDLGLGDLNSYKGGKAESPTLQNKANNILGLIQVVGVVVSVVMLMAIGIKYMLGSVEEKAEYKSSLVPYIIGAFVLFTGSTLPNIIYEFTKNM